MNINNYQSELLKAIRNPELWFSQVVNIATTLSWGVGIWASINVLMFGVVSIGMFLSYDGSNTSVFDIQKFAWSVLAFTSTISAILVTLFGLPRKFINVFDLYAKGRVKSYERIKKEIGDSIKISETLMIKHGLISDEDVETRKTKLKPGQLL